MAGKTLDEQIKCVQREIAMRSRVYPKWVDLKRMKAEEAHHEQETMKAVLATLLTMQSEPMKRLLSLFGSVAFRAPMSRDVERIYTKEGDVFDLIDGEWVRR